MGYIFLLLALILNAVANILLKIGSDKIYLFKEQNFLSALTGNWVSILGIVCFASNVLFYSVALSKLPLSFAYPIMVGGGFLIISIFSLLYLHESISYLQITGMLLVLFGVTLISISSRV